MDNWHGEVPLGCPFCGTTPTVLPERADQGNAWGEVVCLNPECATYCHAQDRGVSVADGEDIADDRGSDGYKAAAIRRWNTRAFPNPPTGADKP